MPAFIYFFSLLLLVEARYVKEKDGALSLKNREEDKVCASEDRRRNRGECKEPKVLKYELSKYHIFIIQGKVGDSLILKCQEYN